MENVNAKLFYKETLLCEADTCKSGSIILNAPCDIKNKYIFKLIYKGFLISEDEIKLGYVHSIKPLKKSYEVELFDFSFSLIDTWGLPPSYNVNAFLTSEQMIDNGLLLKTISPASFIFPLKKSLIISAIGVPTGQPF